MNSGEQFGKSCCERKCYSNSYNQNELNDCNDPVPYYL